MEILQLLMLLAILWIDSTLIDRIGDDWSHVLLQVYTLSSAMSEDEMEYISEGSGTRLFPHTHLPSILFNNMHYL